MTFAVCKRIAIAMVVLVLGMAATKGATGARSTAGSTASTGGAPGQSTPPVRTVPAGTRIAGDPGKKGDTYYWLESQTTRLTTRFADAVVVAERGPGGELRAKVSDHAGNDTANLTATSTVLQYVPTTGRPVQALNDSGEHPTLEWANRQAYSLWRGRRTGAQLHWQGGVMRPANAPAHDLDHEIIELRTEWAGGISMHTRRTADLTYSFTDSATSKKRVLSGDTLAGRVTKDGVEVGRSAWFTRDKVFMWNLPNRTQGFLGPEHMKDFGGWPFTPTAAWVNLQTIAFYHFKTLIDANGFVARNNGICKAPQGNGLAMRLANFFVPTVLANEPGCDGLHWIDGTVLRFCCDVHDMCYERYGCNYHSWWQVWSSWRCDACNAWAAWCFAQGGCSCILDFAWMQPADDRAMRVPQVNT
jgi:hypothetical protein